MCRPPPPLPPPIGDTNLHRARVGASDAHAPICWARASYWLCLLLLAVAVRGCIPWASQPATPAVAPSGSSVLDPVAPGSLTGHSHSCGPDGVHIGFDTVFARGRLGMASKSTNSTLATSATNVPLATCCTSTFIFTFTIYLVPDASCRNLQCRQYVLHECYPASTG